MLSPGCDVFIKKNVRTNRPTSQYDILLRRCTGRAGFVRGAVVQKIQTVRRSRKNAAGEPSPATKKSGHGCPCPLFFVANQLVEFSREFNQVD
jgi:hypothetical protein